MLPPFGYVLFATYPDNSSALRGWADDRKQLVAMMERMTDEEPANLRIGPATDYTLLERDGVWQIALKPAGVGRPTSRLKLI